MTISSSIQRTIERFRQTRSLAAYERQERRNHRKAHRHLVREAGRQVPRGVALNDLMTSAPLDLLASMMRNVRPGADQQAHLKPFIEAALREKRHDVIDAAMAMGATWSTIDAYLDARFVDGLNGGSTPEQFNTVLRNGRPAWQEAFNRVCVSDAPIVAWFPLLDGYLADGARGVSRTQALVEGAARSVVQGGRGYRGGAVFDGKLADGTFIHHGDTNFVPLALADPTLRQEVLNFALRNLYMNPDVVKALLAEGAEPGYQQMKHAAQDAGGDPQILASLDLLLEAGGDIDSIEPQHWSVLPDWLKAKHASIVSRDRAIVAPDTTQSEQISLRHDLGHCYGHPPSPEVLAAIDEAKRRAVPGRITADMLNAKWQPSLTDLRHGFPSSGLPDNLSAPVQFVPMWVHVLFRMPAFERKAELERLLARGADITREGIARHTVFDPEGLVQACFDAFPEVRIHVEGAELREAMAASSSAPGAPRGRKRL